MVAWSRSVHDFHQQDLQLGWAQAAYRGLGWWPQKTAKELPFRPQMNEYFAYFRNFEISRVFRSSIRAMDFLHATSIIAPPTERGAGWTQSRAAVVCLACVLATRLELHANEGDARVGVDSKQPSQRTKKNPTDKNPSSTYKLNCHHSTFFRHFCPPRKILTLYRRVGAMRFFRP